MSRLTHRHWIFIGLAAAAVLAALALLGPLGSLREDEPLSSISAEEVYARAQRTLESAPLYHIEIEVEFDWGENGKGSGQIEQWVDGRAGIVRAEGSSGEVWETISLYTGDGLYTRDGGHLRVSPLEHWTCFDAGPAASAVLGCAGPVDQVSVEVRNGRYDGARVLILVSKVLVRGADTLTKYTRRLYLDPESYLPVASEMNGEHSYFQTERIYETRLFRIKPVMNPDIPAGFFDPATLGQVDPQAALSTASALPVYWLGLHALLRLTLESSFANPPEQDDEPRFELNYRSVDEPNGPVLVTLQLFEPQQWQMLTTTQAAFAIWNGPCWKHENILLGEGRAELFSGYDPAGQAFDAAAPCEPPNLFLAHVYFNQTVVLVKPYPTATPNPMNTREAIEELVRGLRRR